MKIEHKIPTSQFLESVKTTRLPEGLKIAKTQRQIRKIEAFREALFKPLFEGMTDFNDDVHDSFSLNIYTENEKGEITSCARIIFDNPIGLPADDYASECINELRDVGLHLTEISRFAISDEARDQGLLPVYYNTFHAICEENKVDSMIIIINSKSVRFHKNRVGAHLLMEDIGYNYGRDDLKFSCMNWSISQTKPAFFKWVGLEQTGKNETTNNVSNIRKENPYSKHEWNEYSQMFASVLTNVQRELYHDACQYLSGSVVDLGCGPARMAPLLADNENISQYIGIEYAEDMVEIANFTMDKLSKPNFSVECKTIEEAEGQFTSAVSLLSYYSWPNPFEILAHVYEILELGALFVLATPNKEMDQKQLFKEAEKELMWHPDFELFKAYNFKLAENPDANFVSMNEMIENVQSVGFEVVLCHQDHYLSGVNFLVCKKGS